jgi:hypothetical protein
MARISTGVILLLLGLTAIVLVAVAPLCWLLWIADGLVREQRWRHVWWTLPGQEALFGSAERQHIGRRLALSVGPTFDDAPAGI